MEKVGNKIFSCEDCEMAIIAGTVEENPAAAEHLSKCPACREFAQFQAAVLQAQPEFPGEAPGFSQIRLAQRRQQRMRFNCLKFIVLPTAAAAALCISAAGVFMHMQNMPQSSFGSADYTIFADDDAFASVLEESSVTLAWDQPTPRAADTGNLLRDLRESADWNIEMFNPYNEDIQ